MGQQEYCSTVSMLHSCHRNQHYTECVTLGQHRRLGWGTMLNTNKNSCSPCTKQSLTICFTCEPQTIWMQLICRVGKSLQQTVSWCNIKVNAIISILHHQHSWPYLHSAAITIGPSSISTRGTCDSANYLEAILRLQHLPSLWYRQPFILQDRYQ